jgi:peptidoglycan/xylan/chitin deacetylase (PgdA/CDA1 family)
MGWREPPVEPAIAVRRGREARLNPPLSDWPYPPRDPMPRRPRGRRLVAAAALLFCAAAAVTAVAVSAPRDPTSHARRVGSRPVGHSSARPAPPRPDPTLVAVDRVLRTTAYVRVGGPWHRYIALTFDDGPSPYTPQMIRTLVRLRAPATFFIVGQQLTYFRAGLSEELRHGFAVGDHTQNHRPLNRLATALQYAQIARPARAIEHLAGSLPRLFRPPYGLYDARTFGVLRRLHMLMVMWSVDPRDWLRPGTRAIVKRVLQAAQPGTIVELHDGGGDRSQTAAALPAIIAGLRRRHYDLVTVPQLLAADPPPHHQPLPHVSE